MENGSLCLQDSGSTIMSLCSLDLFSCSAPTLLCLGPHTLSQWLQQTPTNKQQLIQPSPCVSQLYQHVLAWDPQPSRAAADTEEAAEWEVSLPVLAAGGGRLLWCPSDVTSQSCFMMVFFLTWFYLPTVKFTWKQNCVCSFCGQNEKLEGTSKEYRKSLETRRQWKKIPVFALLSQRSFN